MAREKFNPIEYLFQKSAFRISFLNANQQCIGCEEVESLAFSEQHYKVWSSKEICPNCDKFKGVYDFKGLEPLEEALKNI